MTTELLLIDLSSIAHPIWHMSQSEPDPNATSTKIVARVRALAADHPKAAICCDSGKSFRHDLSAEYKANRPEKEAPLHHQIDLAKEQLVADGFPVWAVKGFEADDLIAAATTKALEADLSVLIVSADKDLLALVGPRVRAMSANTGTIYDVAGVGGKLGVSPEQVRDYLTLVGDASDNIKGAKSIGPKKAAALLAEYGTLDALYERLGRVGGGKMGLPSSVSASLREFEPLMPGVRALVTLRTDVDVPFAEIQAPRVPKEVETFGVEEEEIEIQQPTAERVSQDEAARVDAAKGGATGPTGDSPQSSGGPSASSQTSLALRDAEVLPAPAEWERGLDPRSMKDARLLAKDLYDSRMFSAYGTPQGVLSTIMVGRELGLPAMASLRSVHNIEGKHSLSASLMVALVLKSGFAEYFEPVSFDDKHATFETKRKGGRKPIELTHTIDMATAAGLVKEKSGWVKNPTDMLVARAQARLARLVYPDLLAGLYTPEELEDIKEGRAA